MAARTTPVIGIAIGELLPRMRHDPHGERRASAGSSTCERVVPMVLHMRRRATEPRTSRPAALIPACLVTVLFVVLTVGVLTGRSGTAASTQTPRTRCAPSRQGQAAS